MYHTRTLCFFRVFLPGQTVPPAKASLQYSRQVTKPSFRARGEPWSVCDVVNLYDTPIGRSGDDIGDFAPGNAGDFTAFPEPVS